MTAPPASDADADADAEYDCIIVGAGPAGSIAARELARGGASVLLVDRARFPRPKVCGCCVNPRALEILARAGLGDLTERLGAVPLTSLNLGAGGLRAVIDHPLGAAVSREAFDAALARAAMEAGAEFAPATSGLLRPVASPTHRAVRLDRDGRSWEARARFVVSATGLTDALFPREHQATTAPRGKLGAGAIAPEAPPGYEPNRIYMACGAEGYVGLVVLEDGRLDLAAALRPEAVREAGGLGALAERVLAGAGLPPVPDARRLPWRGTPILTRSPRRLVEERVFRVGDSAGYVEPFTGEGIAWAIAGGRALGTILLEALQRDADVSADEAARAWRRAHRREIGRRQIICRLAGRALRSPWATRALIRALSLRPGLARLPLAMMRRA